MCGLFGWNLGERIDEEQRRAIGVILAIACESRGKDSWGALNVQTQEIVKGLGCVSTGFRKFWNWPYAMCHTRFATQGAVNLENAHPFVYQNIIGAHNGMVENHYGLNQQHKREFDVDSQHLFAHIAGGMKKSELRAYGAVTYVNTDIPRSTFVSRFNGGQLSVWSIEIDGSNAGILWASEERFIKTALESAGLKGFAWEVVEGRVFEVRGFTMYKTNKKFEPDSPWRQRGRAAGRSYVHETGYWRNGVWTRYDDNNPKRNITTDYAWEKCDLCGRWTHCEEYHTGKGTEIDKICAMCEDRYKENCKAEQDAMNLETGETGNTDACTWCGYTKEDWDAAEAKFHKSRDTQVQWSLVQVADPPALLCPDCVVLLADFPGVASARPKSLEEAISKAEEPEKDEELMAERAKQVATSSETHVVCCPVDAIDAILQPLTVVRSLPREVGHA